MLKRVFDLVVASLALVTLAPVLLVVAVWVRLDSPGPVLFMQERVGRHGRHFRILKFRTMRTEVSGKGLQLTTDQDARVTRAGQVLRKYRLDELPQLVNVVAGHMSIVGPRPEVPRYVACYSEQDKREIFSIRPGITDLASLKFRDEARLLQHAADPESTYVNSILPEKVLLYREYVRTQTLWLDLKIIWQTVSTVWAERPFQEP
jgi:lipopolysaccharide/colanic/teichoic acid biosynthesis glycosyltransferase